MATEDFLVDDGCDWQAVEAIGKSFPQPNIKAPFAWNRQSKINLEQEKAPQVKCQQLNIQEKQKLQSTSKIKEKEWGDGHSLLISAAHRFSQLISDSSYPLPIACTLITDQIQHILSKGKRIYRRLYKEHVILCQFSRQQANRTWKSLVKLQLIRKYWRSNTMWKTTSQKMDQDTKPPSSNDFKHCSDNRPFIGSIFHELWHYGSEKTRRNWDNAKIQQTSFYSRLNGSFFP